MGNSGNRRDLERVNGIEPSSPAWEAGVMPLYDTRLYCPIPSAADIFTNISRFKSGRQRFKVIAAFQY